MAITILMFARLRGREARLSEQTPDASLRLKDVEDQTSSSPLLIAVAEDTRDFGRLAFEDAGFLFAMFSSSLLVWLYLLSQILQRSRDDPTDSTLLGVGFLHYLAFAALLMVALLLFIAGVSRTTLHPAAMKRCTKAYAWVHGFLFRWWLLFLVAGLVALLTLRLGSGDDEWLRGAALVGGVVFVLMTAVLRWLVAGSWRNVASDIWIFGVLGPLYVPYLLLMSVAFANVSVRTDKEFYTTSDTAFISVDRNGYIFHPRIRRVAVRFDYTIYHEVATGARTEAALRVPLDSFAQTSPSLDYVTVFYSIQGLGTSREKHVPLRIARTTSIPVLGPPK